jgi:serine/threonine protein kinase
VFIDWNWIVRIGDFNHSLLTDAFGFASEEEMTTFVSTYPHDIRYTAPECFEKSSNLKSDIFSFGLILSELLTGNPPFPPNSKPSHVMKQFVFHGFCPVIPDWIAPKVKRMILECVTAIPDERPSFTELFSRLNEIEFQITDKVNSVKVQKFVTAVKDREKQLGIEIDDIE